MADNGKGSPLARFSVVAHGADEIEAFVAAIRRLALAKSIEEVMATATPAARRLLHADGITFVLRENDYCHYADEDAVSPLWKGKRFPMDACISGWCMKHGQAVAIRNIYADDRIPHDAYKPTFVRSLAMAPVQKEEPIAAMGAYWAKERKVPAEEVALLQTMADAAALAVANVALRQKEDAAELVWRESDHRLKNVFSVALALAHQTEGTTVQDYRAALVARLEALERAHSAIFSVSSDVIDAKDLLLRLLSPYVEEGRIRLNRETADLPHLPRSEATDLALIIHELAANAAKHGAWSNDTGRVTVSYGRSGAGLWLSWREEGGPRVTPPSRQGFGTRLIEAMASHRVGGHAEASFPPEGFHCRLVVPLDKK